MPIDGIFMTALCRELQELLVNGRIQGVSQPRSDEVNLEVRRPGKTLRLVISAHPEFARIHVSRWQPSNPVSPPAFCLLLRKHLIPGRILAVTQPPFERMLTLEIEGFSEEGGRRVRRLVVELMGRHSNLVLVDAETNAIIDALKRIPAERNAYREILPGRPYVPPPPQQRLSPRELSFDRFDFLLRHLPAGTPLHRGMQQHIAGLSPLAARELVARAGLDARATRDEVQPADRTRLWQALHSLLDALDRGACEPVAVKTDGAEEFWCFPIQTLSGRERRFSTLQELLDDIFSRRVHAATVASRLARLRSALRRHLERVQRKIERQRSELAASQRAAEFRRYGELLTANLYRLREVPQGATSVSVPDFYGDGAEVEVPLDPKLTLSQNAQAYFQRYQKARKTQEKAQEHLSASEAERAYLESVQVALDMAVDEAALAEIEAELERMGYIESQRDDRSRRRREGAAGSRTRPSASTPLRYVTSDGFTVLVGRNNRQNDELTLRTAHPDDLWFHTQEIPGAHVILRCRGAEVPEQSLQEAAEIAAYHSKAKYSENVPVDYTRCKYVRKPRGAKPGMVIYDHQRTLFVTPKELARLAPEAEAADRA